MATEKVIGSVRLKGGEREITVKEIGDGEPVLGIMTGIHGDEKGPVRTVSKMMDEFEDYSGRVVVLPGNVFADEKRTTRLEYQPDEAIEHDMNRSFRNQKRFLEGEDVQLNTTERAGVKQLRFIRDEVDYLVDCHSGAYPTRKLPQVRYKKNGALDDEMRAMAENSGLEHVLVQDGGGSQMLGAVAPELGVPAVTLEIGGAVKPGDSTAFGEREEEMYRGTLTSILDYLLEGRETDTEQVLHREPEFQWFYAPGAGKVELERGLGDRVKEGEKVAAVHNRDGSRVIRSDRDGVIETVITGEREVNEGNKVFDVLSSEREKI